MPPPGDSPRGGTRGLIVLLATLAIVIVALASLQISGEGDALMGRHWYTGDDAPFTNVTVIGYNETYSINLPNSSVPVTGSFNSLLRGGPVFVHPGGRGNVTLVGADLFPSSTVTYVTIVVDPPFTLKNLSESLPSTIYPGGEFIEEISFTAPGSPGLYLIPIGLVADVH